ncbi:unnamed protein product [Ambrosiozyma monospora]|uniref:Unnamed protein product n=1 Tax=Ambrosiozyma monospora TaxID=43982 RepID=A0ACB5SYW9_AMBMO|nr:unnamed protein product [Ambrosiozyma monospora]
MKTSRNLSFSENGGSTQSSSQFKGPKFTIDNYPPHDSAFCRNYPVVAGQFSFDLNVLEGSAASLKSIEIGLKGHVRTGYRSTRTLGYKRIVEKHTDNDILFDQSKVVYDGPKCVESSGLDGLLQSRFHFEFPSDKKIPSTVTYKAWNSTYRATVMYYIYAKLSLFIDDINGKNTEIQKNKKEVIKEFHYPLIYQENETADTHTGPESHVASDCFSWSFIWRNFSILEPKSAKTFAESLISRKPKVMSKFRLQITSEIPRTIDISKGFEQIPVSFEVAAITNIEDFIMENQSTTLGRFRVESISIKFTQDVYVTGNKSVRYYDYQHNFSFTTDYDFDTHLIQNKAIIDMADGQYDPKKGTLTYNTTLNKLFSLESPPPSSFVHAFQGVPLASCSDSLPDSRLGFTNIFEFKFLMKHTQCDLKPRKVKTRVWNYYCDRLRFQRTVDLAYRVDDSTAEGDLVNGLRVDSGGTEVDSGLGLDESKQTQQQSRI